jgi:eukaryotic-like serine/threonine-protein kinase
VEAQPTSQPASDDLIITLFLAAMSCPEAERGQFVREACSGDVALQAEVARRVKWETRLNGFLLTPVLARDRFDLVFAPGDTVLRRFRILRVAGEGGMGVVYEAFDEKLGHRIALKCPRFEFRKRLSPEVMKSLRVTHPNVCRVFEIHTEETNTGAIDFLTMEFLDGQTLAERLGRAPARWLGTPEGTEIARQLCTGLKAVHAEGIVHRDLKATNVMLTTGSAGSMRAVITDFGIAQGADIFSSQIRGTPSYLRRSCGEGSRPQSNRTSTR